MAICSTCGVEKTPENTSWTNKGHTRLATYCKKCMAQRAKQLAARTDRLVDKRNFGGVKDIPLADFDIELEISRMCQSSNANVKKGGLILAMKHRKEFGSVKNIPTALTPNVRKVLETYFRKMYELPEGVAVE